MVARHWDWWHMSQQYEVGQNKSSSQKGRPRSQSKLLYFGTPDDVNRWLRKYCGQFYQLYGGLFKQHDINGRALARLNDITLQRMGVTNRAHREELMRHILRLKLETDLKELKALDQKSLGLEKKS
ncbi:Protein aveugle [Lamellibrachia satsuma]|nr:Protein aveugle [Lamellibrachia satsuma]